MSKRDDHLEDRESSSPEKKLREQEERESLIEVSSLDLNQIFFPDSGILPEDDKEKSGQLKDIYDAPTFAGQKDHSSSSKIPKISIEEATPLPSRDESSLTGKVSPPTKPPEKSSHSVKIRKRSSEDIPHTPKPQKIKMTERRRNVLHSQSSADITRIFFPANRIDEKGNIIPAEEPRISEKDDTGTRIQQSSGPFYILMLAYGRRIRLRKCVQICSELWGISPRAAQRRIRFGKGILFEHLERGDALRFQERFLSVNQGVHIVRETEGSHLPEPLDVNKWLFSGRHFQIVTESDKQVFAWENINLVSAGNVRISSSSDSHKKVLDIILDEPYARLRIWDNTFNYKASGIGYDFTGKTNLYNLLKILKRYLKKARLSPIVKEMLEHKQYEPRDFEMPEEFDNYNRWLFLTYFGKPLA